LSIDLDTIIALGPERIFVAKASTASQLERSRHSLHTQN
jgi:hypothetical protein